MDRSKSRALLATSSVVAMIAAGSTPAYAVCTTIGNSGFTNPISTTISCAIASSATITGNVVNAGTITPGGPFGIKIFNGTLNGAIINSGTISGQTPSGSANGIWVRGAVVTGGISNSGTISAPARDILVELTPSFGGGITNTGSLSSPSTSGIQVFSVSNFTGGITNSGTISLPTGTGISVNTVSTFSGGITNSGTISALSQAGISVDTVSTFVGGITNTGTISGAGSQGAIIVNSLSSFVGGITNRGSITFTGNGSSVGAIVVASVSAFSGGISNAGTISASHGAGIRLGQVTSSGTVLVVSTFAGGITNTGRITAAQTGILVSAVSTFSGGISNAGTISATAGAGIKVANVATVVGASSTVLVVATPVSAFSGGITNSGTISATAGVGIQLGSIATTTSDVRIFGSVSTFTGGIANTGTIRARTGIMLIGGVTFGGGISNAGTISANGAGIQVGDRTSSGILASVGTFTGGIANTGTITASTGILTVGVATFGGGITNRGRITASAEGIVVSATSTFAGGISNAGTITAPATGIAVLGGVTFGGGITNSGTISAAAGIQVILVSTFSGGISNAGTITSSNRAISVGVPSSAVSTFSGGITNSGTITAGQTGIRVLGGATFSGAIANTGNITGTTAAIDVSAAPNAMTIDQIAGTITGAIKLSPFADMLNISGGVINGNIVGLGSSDSVNFVLGTGGMFTYANTISGVSAVNVNSGTVLLTGTIGPTALTIAAPGTLVLGNGGVISGNVTDNGIFAVSRTDTFTYAGTISGTGAFEQLGSGKTILTGTNTYQGGSILQAGTLAVSTDTNLGAASGPLTFNGGTLQFLAGFATTRNVTINPGGGSFDTNGNNATLAGPIAGLGGLTKNGTGTLTLTANDTYSGGTTINAGTLQLGNGGTTGSIVGDVLNNGALTVNRSDTVTIGGTISGSGSFAQIGTGTTILTANNSYSGGTTIATGSTLQLGNGGASGSIVGSVVDNGVLISNNSITVTLSSISGTGSVVQAGSGTIVVTGAETYTGPTFVTSGVLDVNGSLASIVNVDSGGLLKGNGTIGGLTVASGGGVAPGNSIGTLHVAGNASFAVGSNYQVQLNAAGASDQILVTGTTTIAGGTVQVMPALGNYPSSFKYTILTANGGVNGTFTNAVSDFAFLIPMLSYDANDVFLTLSRNPTFFQSQAQTSNQRSVGAALDASPLGSAIVQPLLFQTPAGTLQAFDAMSGEIHGSVQSELIDDSLYVRQAMLGRLRQAAFAHAPDAMEALGFDGPVTVAQPDESSALGYAPDSGFPVKAPPLAPHTFGSDVTSWSQGVGAWGHIGGDGNAADVRRDFGGFFSGVDARFGEFARIGLVGGYTHSSINVSARASSAGIDTAYLGVYAGANIGAFNWRAGASYGFHTIDTSRTIVFPGLSDSATAHYDGGTGQIFGEVGYGFALGRIAAEPFAGLAWVHLRTDAFTEAAAVAALNGSSSTDDVGYSTFGARVATNFLLPNGMALIPRASAAWQHALENVTPAVALAFQNTGAGFAISGVPLARDAALVETALDLRVSPQAKFGLSYSGELAGHLQDHSVKGNFTWNF